ncbi:hypothetical protein Gogos_004748, partial [Gossypium gossypioides]|nr:hypothetical protein [Gossypium gossypioides]
MGSLKLQDSPHKSGSLLFSIWLHPSSFSFSFSSICLVLFAAGSILQLKLEASLTSTFWLLVFDAAADQSGTIVEILAEDGKAVSVDMVSIPDFLDS